MKYFPFDETPGITIKELVMGQESTNLDTIELWKDVVGTDTPIKFYIDAQGDDNTINYWSTSEGTRKTESVVSQSMEQGLERRYILRTIERLDAILDIDFDEVRTKDESNISFQKVLNGDPFLAARGMPEGGGWCAYNLYTEWNPDRNNDRWVATNFRNELLFTYNEEDRIKGSDYWQYIIIHELGHALGLEHPFENADGDVFGEEASTTRDQLIMAYGWPKEWGVYSEWYSPIEIEALVSIWGAEDNPNRSNLGIRHTGSDQSELLEGRLGYDWADDDFRGAGGDDVIRGNQGADSLYGNEGEDTIFGGLGIDILYGGKDADQIYGNQGEDHLYGNLGDDLIYGGKSNDWQHGGQGEDRLYGNLGDDVIYGGKSNDWLHGGQGDDVLYGNLGADVFNLSAGSDRVMDFDSNGGDRIAIRSGVTYSIQAQGADVLINTDVGSLLLVGAEFSSFNSEQSIVTG